jgi:hypothetical protein
MSGFSFLGVALAFAGIVVVPISSGRKCVT